MSLHWKVGTYGTGESWRLLALFFLPGLLSCLKKKHPIPSLHRQEQPQIDLEQTVRVYEKYTTYPTAKEVS